MHTALRALLLALALASCTLAAVSAEQRGRESDEKGRERHAERRDRDQQAESYFHRYGYTRLNIPKGHYPPPGECRVWFPDRPAGHQPPSSRCDEARVPRGAWLIRHPQDRPEHVHVVVYDERRPDSILAIGEFKIGTGVFVRVVIDR